MKLEVDTFFFELPGPLADAPADPPRVDAPGEDADLRDFDVAAPPSGSAPPKPNEKSNASASSSLTPVAASADAARFFCFPALVVFGFFFA